MGYLLYSSVELIAFRRHSSKRKMSRKQSKASCLITVNIMASLTFLAGVSLHYVTDIKIVLSS